MIKITIATIKADASFVVHHPCFTEGETVYFVIRENGKRLSIYYHTEAYALKDAWMKVKEYGLTLVEPW